MSKNSKTTVVEVKDKEGIPPDQQRQIFGTSIMPACHMCGEYHADADLMDHKTNKKGWQRICPLCMAGVESQREYSSWRASQTPAADDDGVHESGGKDGGSSASTAKGQGKGKGYEEGWHDAINMIIDMLYEKGEGKGKGKSKGSEGNEDTDAKGKGKKRDGPY